MGTIDVVEMKKLQLDILADVAAFCDKHGLRYYLSGGTMLGAVRHQGFIPWDDDIDIQMPRPDFWKKTEALAASLASALTFFRSMACRKTRKK